MDNLGPLAAQHSLQRVCRLWIGNRGHVDAILVDKEAPQAPGRGRDAVDTDALIDLEGLEARVPQGNHGDVVAPGGESNEATPGWVRHAGYMGKTDPIAMVTVTVTDSGSVEEASGIYQLRRTVADGVFGLGGPPPDVAGVGDQGFYVTNALVSEILV